MEVSACGGEAVGGRQAHDADGEVDGADGADGFGGEGGVAGVVGCGDFGEEALERGLQLRARCGCYEGEEEEVGELGFRFRWHGWG